MTHISSQLLYSTAALVYIAGADLPALAQTTGSGAINGAAANATGTAQQEECSIDCTCSQIEYSPVEYGIYCAYEPTAPWPNGVLQPVTYNSDTACLAAVDQVEADLNTELCPPEQKTRPVVP